MEPTQVQVVDLKTPMAEAMKNLGAILNGIEIAFDESQVGQLQQQLVARNSELEDFQHRCDHNDAEYDKNIQMLQNQIAKDQRSHASTVKDNTNTINHLKQKLKDAEAHVRAGQKALEVSRADNVKLQEAFNQLALNHKVELDLSDQKSDIRLESAQAREEELKVTVKSLTDQIEDLKSQDNGKLRDEIAQLKQELAAEKANTEALKATHQGVVDDYESKRKMLLDANSNLQESLKQRSQQVERMFASNGISATTKSKIIQVRRHGVQLYASAYELYHYAVGLQKQLEAFGAKTKMPALEGTRPMPFINWETVEPEDGETTDGEAMVVGLQLERSNTPGVFTAKPFKSGGKKDDRQQGDKKNRKKGKKKSRHPDPATPEVVDNTEYRGPLAQGINVSKKVATKPEAKALETTEPVFVKDTETAATAETVPA